VNEEDCHTLFRAAPPDKAGIAVVEEVQNEESTQEPVNYVIGGQWDINRSFSVLAELGFGKRESQMLNLTYRF
jgi:hypothetical protein